MADDYLYLRPLENDERLIQSLINFCNPDHEQPPHPRLETCRSELTSFIDQTCKNVVNASCPIDDYPQQYRLNQYHLSQQQLNRQHPNHPHSNQQNENLPTYQNSQYQIFQINNCPQFYRSVDDRKLNTAYNPVQSVQPYFLDSNTIIQPWPTTNPCFRIVSSQSDPDCQLMEPAIIPATTNFTQSNRQPLGEIQNQSNSRFSQQPATCGSVDLTGQTPGDYSPEAPFFERTNQSTQLAPGDWRPDDVPAEFRVLPDSLMRYFQTNSQLPDGRSPDGQSPNGQSSDSQTANQRSPTDTQERSQELEASLAENRNRLKMIKRTRRICSQVRYSPKHLLYLNGLEHLHGEELERKLANKSVQEQIKRIQAANRQLRTIKFKNRDTKNVDLKALYTSARKLDLESRARRIKQLILNLEAKVMN